MRRGLLVVFLAIPCFGQAAVSQNAIANVRPQDLLCSVRDLLDASRSGLSGTP